MGCVNVSESANDHPKGNSNKKDEPGNVLSSKNNPESKVSSKLDMKGIKYKYYRK